MPVVSPREVKVLDYYDRVLQAIYRQIELQKWLIGRYHSKAKITISTGAVVLSITTVATAGLAALLSRTSLAPFALLESLFGAFATAAICLAIVGIVTIIGSMITSIRALRGRRISQILSSGEFEVVPKGGRESHQNETSTMSNDELGERLQRNAVGTVRTLEKYIDWVAPRVHVGQVLLLVGIGFMSSVPIAAFIWALLSRAPA